MAKFTAVCMDVLNQQFPEEGNPAKLVAARQHWLDSEERSECIKRMSDAEKKRRRF